MGLFQQPQLFRIIIILAFCGAAFGAAVTPEKQPQDIEPLPENVTLSMEGWDYIDFFADVPAKDYLTEQFLSTDDAFDLIYHSVTFIPTPDGTSYTVEIQQISQLPTNPAKGFDLELSDREFEIFRLISEGYKASQIAKQLHLSTKTIETYRSRLRKN